MHIMQFLLGLWPQGFYVKDTYGLLPLNYVACPLVVSLGCNDTMMQLMQLPQDWKLAAINLECKLLAGAYVRCLSGSWVEDSKVSY